MSVDIHLKKELATKVCILAERYAPNNEWYLNTMIEVFLAAENTALIEKERCHNLMRFVAEGLGSNDEEDEAFRRFAVNTFIKLLDKRNLPDILVQVIAWVLGEYSNLCTQDGYEDPGDIVDALCDYCRNLADDDAETRSYILSALIKIHVANPRLAQVAMNDSSSFKRLLDKYKHSRSTDLQQKCYEYGELLKMVAGGRQHLAQNVLPYDAFCEDVEIDRNLGFLSNFVQASGSAVYKTSIQRREERLAKAREAGGGAAGDMDAFLTGGGGEQKSKDGMLNFTPYERPTAPPPNALFAGMTDTMGGGGASGSVMSANGHMGGATPGAGGM